MTAGIASIHVFIIYIYICSDILDFGNWKTGYCCCKFEDELLVRAVFVFKCYCIVKKHARNIIDTEQSVEIAVFGNTRHYAQRKIVPLNPSMLLFHVVCSAVLQPQCEERSTNGLAPWAATTSHNPALTPPTLWQYPGKCCLCINPPLNEASVWWGVTSTPLYLSLSLFSVLWNVVRHIMKQHVCGTNSSSLKPLGGACIVVIEKRRCL